MRSYHLQQVLALLKTLEDATGEIKQLLSRREFEATIALLADCQAGALQIGNFIETAAGEGTKTVTLLEAFCDLLYEVSNNIENEASGVAKKLKRQLIQINNCILSELKADQVEIAFLPYKASMWDAMESVWLAAVSDENCIPYVIPIPYVDRNDDGSAGEMHYEGHDYPPNVPIVDWHDYDLEARHPDVIIIHNPYDNENRVTSVHPNYYSSKLKEHCDLLCYIPYYVATEQLQEDFCIVSGVSNADRVYVQSEQIRQFYLATIHRLERMQKKPASQIKLEKKIVASGSPKFDKAIIAKQEDYPLPENWRSLIYRPDGSRKKVVLFNTALAAMLQYNATYLDKLENVLRSFTSQKDLVLWWRPHPLQGRTFCAMCPHLAKRYQAIVDAFQAQNVGIYDETADLYRALTHGDAYYGDWSSLVLLFGAMGKPIMLQETVATNIERGIHFASLSFDETGAGWAWSLYFNSLFKLDFGKNIAQLVTHDKTTMGDVMHAHDRIRICGNKVISFPIISNHIHAYDTATQSETLSPISREYVGSYDGIISPRVSDTVYHDGSYYVFSSIADAVLVYNVETAKISYHSALYARFGSYKNGAEGTKSVVFLSDPTEDGWVNLMLEECDSFIRYHLPTQKIEVVATSPYFAACATAIFDGERYWMTSKGRDAILAWSPSSTDFVVYNHFPSHYMRSHMKKAYTFPVDCGSYLLLFPTFDSMILKLDKVSGQISEYTKLPVPDETDTTQFKYARPVRVGDKLYCIARFDATIYELDLTTDEVTPHRFILAPEDYSTYQEMATYRPPELDQTLWRSHLSHDNYFASDTLLSAAQDADRSVRQKEAFLQLNADSVGKSGETILSNIKKAFF